MSVPDSLEELLTQSLESLDAESVKQLLVKAALGRLLEGTEARREQSRGPADAREHGKRLPTLHARLLQRHPFAVGQLVRWKEGLRNRRRPSYEQPAVVVEVLAQPIFDTEKNSGTPYFREPLDILLGILDPDGDFVVYHYDSRRFEPIPAQAVPPEATGASPSS